MVFRRCCLWVQPHLEERLQQPCISLGEFSTKCFFVGTSKIILSFSENNRYMRVYQNTKVSQSISLFFGMLWVYNIDNLPQKIRPFWPILSDRTHVLVFKGLNKDKFPKVNFGPVNNHNWQFFDMVRCPNGHFEIDTALMLEIKKDNSRQ